MSLESEHERDQLLQVMEFSRLGFWRWDAESDLVTMSERAADIFGISPGPVMTWADMRGLLLEPDRELARLAVEAAVERRMPYEIAYRIKRPPDGMIVWIASRGRVHYADGKAVGMIGIVEDITSLKELESALAAERRSLEGSFQLLVESVSDYAIFMLDADGMVTNWNTGAQRIKGYRANEIVGRHFSTFYTDEDREQGVPQRNLAMAARDGKCESEGWRVRKDGTRFWANVVVNAIGGPDGRLVGFAKVTRDVTERREAEHALRRTQEQLVQAQKMEGIGQLTGGVAHDFNNLLTIILGNLESILRSLNSTDMDRDRIFRMASNAMQGADRAAALTQRLLAFSRRQPLDPKPVDVGRLVVTMSDLLRRTLGEQISIETVLAGGLWKVNVDANQLEVSLLNLAINARDAMPDGGKLTIETANAFLDEKYASAQAEVVPGQYVVICMTDTGTGMTKEILARAFEPFFTTKDVGHGTGLGLSQVYGFVKQSGGHIRIYTEVGEGTAVKIYLPRILSDEVVSDETASAKAMRLTGSETILLVEDEENVRAYSADILVELGYTVIEAPDGHVALRLLDLHPEVRLLFTDVGLPKGMNGRELANEALRRRPDLKVLFTSGYTRNAIVHEGRLDPGVNLISKPFSYLALAKKLRDILDDVPSKR
jgi:PAS domain S-box-containing protein